MRKTVWTGRSKTLATIPVKSGPVSAPITIGTGAISAAIFAMGLRMFNDIRLSLRHYEPYGDPERKRAIITLSLPMLKQRGSDNR